VITAREVTNQYENKKFKNKQQQEKVISKGECALDGCRAGVLMCPRCDTWWRLDTPKRKVLYDAAECPLCGFAPITHNFYCEAHQDICPECELDHSLPGCPYRDLRDGRAPRPRHEDWFCDRIDNLTKEGSSWKDLIVALFGTGKGDPMEGGRDWRLLQSIHNREVASSAGWESDEMIRRRRHSAPAATRAGMLRARLAGKKLGRPPKQPK
jgi:hypothetical protein